MTEERETQKCWPHGIRGISAALTFAIAGASAVFAQSPEIVIGQSAGYTGRTSSSVKEFMEGAQAWFESVNKKGGIGAQDLSDHTG